MKTPRLNLGTALPHPGRVIKLTVGKQSATNGKIKCGDDQSARNPKVSAVPLLTNAAELPDKRNSGSINRVGLSRRIPIKTPSIDDYLSVLAGYDKMQYGRGRLFDFRHFF